MFFFMQEYINNMSYQRFWTGISPDYEVPIAGNNSVTIYNVSFIATIRVNNGYDILPDQSLEILGNENEVLDGKIILTGVDSAMGVPCDAIIIKKQYS